MHSNFSIRKASCKIKKYLNLGQKMLYLSIFGLECKNDIFIFEINPIKFVWVQSLVQNKNPQIWDQKCLICEFSGWNLKILLSWFISTSSILPCCKVWCKNKNAYIWDQKCLILVFLDWNLKKLLSYLKSALSNLSDWKFREKTKMSKFETQNA